jgi:hypothetical protein
MLTSLSWFRNVYTFHHGRLDGRLSYAANQFGPMGSTPTCPPEWLSPLRVLSKLWTKKLLTYLKLKPSQLGTPKGPQVCRQPLQAAG